MSECHTLLILEDDPQRSEELAAVFADLDVTVAPVGEKALALVRRIEPEVVLFDLGDSGSADEGRNLALLRQILSIAPATRLIAMTGEHSRDLSVKAVGLGATDFYHLPLNGTVLSMVVRRALRMRELETENSRLREQTGAMTLEGFIGTSDAIRQLCRAVQKVAPTNATVLVLGESGTGKELVARALHRLSGRVHEPFVAINCAAIPENLLESELFGYEKGAFTGAAQRTLGKLELAGRGTVFLDEMGEMPAPLQAKLLRVVQERTVERIGGRTPVPLESRLV
ncbi:MAG TPA: sigma 54-interacting transcriptional regulator, partial [Steroidobacteraceae bacterium]|nr:sigma 54-interacting transcriptional regulator [Steroidobacteraceae bacterium]